MNAQKYHWCETSLFLSQAALKHVVSKDFIFKKSKAVQGILLRMKKSMALFHIKNFSCHVTLATFKKENFNMWVTSGSHPDCSVGQWVKWVSRCDPLSTLVHTTIHQVDMHMSDVLGIPIKCSYNATTSQWNAIIH